MIKTVKKIFFLLFFIPLMTFGQSSMFQTFKGKPYGSIHYALRDTLRTIYYPRDKKRLELALKEMAKMPDTFGDHQWELEAEFLKIHFDYNLEKLTKEQFEAALKDLLRKCDLYDNTVFKLRIYRVLYFVYGSTIANPDGADAALNMEKLIDKITIDDFPDIPDYKQHLGCVYMECGAYQHAEELLLDVIKSPFQPENPRIFLHARDELAVMARIYHHDLDASDKWAKSILQLFKDEGITYKDVIGKDIRIRDWEAIVNATLGKNEKLRRNYKAAIPLLESSIAYMLDSIHDYSFCANYSALLAECYIALSNQEEAKSALNVSAACYDSIRSLSRDRSVYLMAMSRYYSMVGDPQNAALYLDSAELVRKNWLDTHSLAYVYQSELKLNDEAMEQVLKEKENVFSTMVISLIALGVAISAIVGLIIHNIRRRREYHALALKVQQWAAQSSPMAPIPSSTPSPSATPPQEEPKEEIDEKNNELFQKVKELLTETQLYRSPDVSLQSLARELGTNRTALSTAINLSGTNFNAMLNAYRINDAIHIINSQPDCSLGDVAAMVGFGNRRSFNIAFKMLTGLTPSQFKGNL